SSAQLIARAQAGDTSSLDELIGRYLPRLRQWAHGRLPARERGARDTQDAVQDVLMKAARHLPRLNLQSDGALEAYLRVALTRHFTDMYRRAARRPIPTALSSQIPATAPTPHDDLSLVQTRERFDAALARLSDTDRQAILLRIELGWSYDEIAK